MDLQGTGIKVDYTKLYNFRDNKHYSTSCIVNTFGKHFEQDALGYHPIVVLLLSELEVSYNSQMCELRKSEDVEGLKTD